MREIRRLVFVPGPWQLLLAASALRQATATSDRGSRDDVVFFSLQDGPVVQPMHDVMNRIAPVAWPWRRIMFLGQSTIAMDLNDDRRSIEALRAAFGTEEYDELWMVRLYGVPEKFATEVYPSARIVLFEDGLHSYLPADDHQIGIATLLNDPRAAYRALKLRIRERLHPNDLSLAAMLPRHLARVSASYLWISLMLPPPAYQSRLPWVQIQTRAIRETIERVSPLANEVAVESGSGPMAVVLGQCFSNYGDFDREAELDLYIDMARRLHEMGYEVLWKEHPRTRQPFLPELTAAVAGIHALPDLGPWPIELFADRLGLAACASVSSTSLYNLPLLFGMPSFSPAGRYLSSFRYPNDVMAQLISSSITHLDESTPRLRTRPVAAASAHGRPEDLSHSIS